jgi:hypothetical protein
MTKSLESTDIKGFQVPPSFLGCLSRCVASLVWEGISREEGSILL